MRTFHSRLMLVGGLSLALIAIGGIPAVADSASDDGLGNTVGSDTPASVIAENNPTLTHQYDLYIENFAGGVIDKVVGGVHARAGLVTRPATAVAPADAGFWATKYDKSWDNTRSVLVANSVYALHVKVGPNSSYNPLSPASWTARMFSMRPKEFYDHAGGSYSASTLYTNIVGGSQIFGGYSSPPSGSPVKYLDGSVWKPLADYYSDSNWSRALPARLMISVYKPSTESGSPDYIEFENWADGDTVGGVAQTANGAISVHYPGGISYDIAEVLQRVAGTGRFHGTEYSKVGQLTTNHPGAITISTSAYKGWVNYNTQLDLLGGIQIVPSNHAKYLHYDLGQTAFYGRSQWLIVGPIGASSALMSDSRYTIAGELSYNPGWEGISPLFGGYMRTTNVASSPSTSTYAEVSRDFGATWVAMPLITGTTEPPTSDVNNWTNIRINLSY